MRGKKQSTDNIRQIGLANNNLGSAKYINDDWGTVAFLIPRTSLQSQQFIDPELIYNCIYFLIGNNEFRWCAYVGQAKKRNNGGSVLFRLREHDKAVYEKYYNKWTHAIVVTNKTDTWGIDDLNALENILYQEIPLEKNLNGNTPNSAGADVDKYIDKVKQIKSYIAILGIDIFEKPENIENLSIVQEVNDNTPVEDLQNGLSRVPEIVTPQKVVKAMIDILPDEVWNSKTTFIDLACKGGEYLKEIYNRLMDTEALKIEFPNEITRAIHILEKQLFGISLSKVSLDRTINALSGYGKNIRIIQNYIDILKTKGADSLIVERLKGEFGQVNFDVIIGNPPYQEGNGSGNGAGANSLYEKFLDKALQLSTSYISMITKSSWFNGNNYIDIRLKMLSGNHMKKIVDYIDASDVFPGMSGIAGGVSYFLWDKSYIGTCELIHHNRDKCDKAILDLNPEDIIVRYPSLATVVEKVKSYNEKSLSTIVSQTTPFGFDTNGLDYASIIKTQEYDIRLIGSRGRDGYVSIDQIGRGQQFIDNYNVIINRSMSEHGCMPDKNGKFVVLTKPLVMNPGEICTGTYLIVGASDSLQIIENIKSYLCTKFVRALMLSTLASKSINRDTFRFVPTQDFTSNSGIDWTQSITDIDKQLYKKYGLNQEEIEYIENTIKPMV